MTFQLVQDDGLQVLRMQAGENRINLPFTTGLHEQVTAAAETGGPLVLTGEGKFFCNGLDLEAFAASGEDAEAVMAMLHRVFAQLLSFPGPVVAAINGHAFGAGAILAAAADFRVMRSDRGYFCFPEVDLGLPMSDEFDAVLRAKYPPSALLRALLSGARLGGPEARDMGFVDAVVPEDELLATASGLVRDLAGKDPAAVRRLKTKQHKPVLDALGVLGT
jgi:Delta3-Delta2-enoyl-CoA isomerase